LIDAGISATSIRKFLRNMDISMQTIMGVLITHNHIDHIRGLEVLTRKNNLPAFTTNKIWKSILRPQKKISRLIREILNQKFHLAGFDIEAFPVVTMLLKPSDSTFVPEIKKSQLLPTLVISARMLPHTSKLLTCLS
jgi:metal-dependent hydrolase (beta-lactamase superfamily II)